MERKRPISSRSPPVQPGIELNLSRHIGRLSWAAAARLLPPLSGLILLLTILPTITVSEYGRYNLIFIIATQIMLLSKSLALNPMIKLSAEPGRFERMSSVGLGASFGTIIILGGAVASIAPLVARILRVEPGDILLAASLPLAFWLRDWGFCVQQTLYRTGRLFAIEATYYLGVSAGCIWIWSRGGGTSYDVLKVNFIFAGLSSLLAVIIAPRGISVSIGALKSELAPLLKYGSYTLGITAAAIILAGADILVVGAIYTPEVVGIYSGAKRVYGVASAVISTVGLLVMPYASRLSAEGRREETRELMEKSLAYVTASLALICIGGWLVAGPVYRLLLPAEYAPSALILKLLLIAAPFEGIYNISGSLLYGVGAAGAVALSSAAGVAAMIIALPLGAYYYSLTGAALSQVFGAGVAAVAMYRKASQFTGIDLAGITRRLTACFRLIPTLISHRRK